MRDARGGQRQCQLMLSTSVLGLSSPAVALSSQFHRAPTRPAVGRTRSCFLLGACRARQLRQHNPLVKREP